MAHVFRRTSRAAPVPRTFAEAHFYGMEATSRLRERLAGRLRSLIAVARGDINEVAVALGMLPWKVRQIADGHADPTLGEIGRIASQCGEPIEAFMGKLLNEATERKRRSPPTVQVAR